MRRMKGDPESCRRTANKRNRRGFAFNRLHGNGLKIVARVLGTTRETETYERGVATTRAFTFHRCLETARGPFAEFVARGTHD